MKKAAVGIDIGGTNTILGIVDQKGNCLFEKEIFTDSGKGIVEYLHHLSDIIEEGKILIKDEYKIEGIGIGAPNGNTKTGNIEFAPNLPWKGVLPLVEEFRKIRVEPVILANDANAAAIGEMIYGGAKGMKDFLVITIGTGLGSGFVSNGRLITGHDGLAGELGHINVYRNGRLCNCGRRGCLETYVSAVGIKKTLHQLFRNYSTQSELRSVSFKDLDSRMITEAAMKGDKLAQLAFDYTGMVLGRKLSDVVALTSPRAIFVLGGVANAGDLIISPTKTSMEDNMMKVFSDKVEILPSFLNNNPAVLGSSALVWDKNFFQE